jgi:hypothetical protein
MATEGHIALTNRALRTIRTVSHSVTPTNSIIPVRGLLTNNAISIQELEFLTDSSVISPQQLSSILSQLPAQTQLHAPLQAGALASGATTTPVETFGALNVKDHYTTIPSPAPLPPPAYASGPQVLSIASALYAYSPTDAGDLALQQNDRIQVTEHMNNDCENCQCLLQTNC